MLPSTERPERPRHTITAGIFHLNWRQLPHLRDWLRQEFWAQMFYFLPSSSNTHFQSSIPNSSGCPASPRWHIPPGSPAAHTQKAAAGSFTLLRPSFVLSGRAVWKRIRVERRGRSSIARKMEGRAGRMESGGRE